MNRHGERNRMLYTYEDPVQQSAQHGSGGLLVLAVLIVLAIVLAA